MKSLLAALLFVPLLAFVTMDWVTVSMDERATISFPATPETSELQGNPVWTQEVDKDAKCMAMVVDFAKLGMDSATLSQEMMKEQAIADFRGGLLGEIANSKLISERKMTVAGHLCFEFTVDMGKPNQTDEYNIMYSRNMFVGHKMYTIMFYEKNDKPRQSDRNKFFDSFALDNVTSGWSTTDINEFITTCTNTAAKSMDESKARTYCTCMQEKLQKIYPDSKDADKLKASDFQTEEMKRMIQHCLTGQDRDSASSGWTTKDVNLFITSCTNVAAKSMGEPKAKSYCTCMQPKIEKIYPDPKEAAKLKVADMQTDEMKRMIQSCLTGQD